MGKVYVVTEGEYSDYGIVSIWENKEDAEIVANSLARPPYHYGHVEEWTLNARLERDKLVFHVDVSAGGGVSVSLNGFPREDDGEYGEFGIPYQRPVNKSWYVRVLTSSKERAEKIGLDLIAQEKARKEGVL